MHEAYRAIEAVARDAYGRLVSYLAARTHDVAAAEDALADALVAALRTWPRAGVPDKPEAWLLKAARHRLVDEVRRQQVRVSGAPTLALAAEEAEAALRWMPFPDERLRLLFLSAHPAIDADVHTPLMLQTVLGLNAARIARAFLVSPATMGQRLVRAKAKIRAAGIAFDLPEAQELAGRLHAVLEAVYAAYGTGWDDFDGADRRTRGLATETLWLSCALAQLLPNEPEALGLFALMLYCEARRPARRAARGRYVPLAEQDTSLWVAPMIEEAERRLGEASALKRPGRFQLEAAIQSAHIQRLRGGHGDWNVIALLYEGLVRAAPTLGAMVGCAAAVAEAKGAAAGLARLSRIPSDNVATYQPFWAVRAHLLKKLGQDAAAADAFDRAIGLSEDAAVRRFLLDRR